jgi:hypothetical protein
MIYEYMSKARIDLHSIATNNMESIVSNDYLY